jgi:hypothetical protein
VRSDDIGNLNDDIYYAFQKVIVDVTKQLAVRVKGYTENILGKGESYEAWRLTFANVVGGHRYFNDEIMGMWLRSRLEQDVANEALLGMGTDESGTPRYWHSSAKELDVFLQKTVFSDQSSDHHYNKEMGRQQRVNEPPLVFVRAMQKIAGPIFASGGATEQYLASQILEGFSDYWKRNLCIRFQSSEEVVYTAINSLVTGVRRFHYLYLAADGSQQEIPRVDMNNNTFPQSKQGASGFKSPFTTLSEPLVTGPIKVSRAEFNQLPSFVQKGGHESTRGQGVNFVCSTCFKMDHTFEYCNTHNGYKQGGPPVFSW